jgi:hypothetical protein
MTGLRSSRLASAIFAGVDEGRGVEVGEAARLAGECAVTRQALALARWIGAGRRQVTAGKVLRRADVPAVGAAIGVAVPASLRTMADVPSLHRPWCVAVATGLLSVGGGWVTTGAALESWPPGAERVLCEAYELEFWGPLHAASRYSEVGDGQLSVSLTGSQRLDGLVKLLAEFGMVSGGVSRPVVTPLGRWDLERLRDGLVGPADPSLTAAELIAEVVPVRGDAEQLDRVVSD